MYVRIFNKAYYCENNAAERWRNASSFVEWKNTVGLYPLYTRARIKHSMNWYSIEPIDIIHDIVPHGEDSPDWQVVKSTTKIRKVYYNKILFLRVVLHLEYLKVTEEIDFSPKFFQIGSMISIYINIGFISCVITALSWNQSQRKDGIERVVARLKVSI